MVYQKIDLILNGNGVFMEYQRGICACDNGPTFLLNCIICEGKCCIDCMDPQIQLVLCPICSSKQVSLQTDMDLKLNCDRCSNNYVNKIHCAGCNQLFKHCDIHVYQCGFSSRFGDCKKMLCFECNRCINHKYDCCKCFEQDLDEFIQCQQCSNISCMKCADTIFLFHKENIMLCRDHMSYCYNCRYPAQTKHIQCEYRSGCDAKQLCVKCNGFKMKHGIKIYCDNHINYCIKCKLHYPKDAKRNIGSLIECCSNCNKHIMRELFQLIGCFNRHKMKLYKDMQFIILQYIIS